MAQQAAPQGAKASKWLALTAAVLAFSYTFLSRYIWSPLMTDVSNEFGIGATQAGLYMSAFFMGYLITQIPGGLMADKLQPKYILIVCTLCSGLATALMSVIPGYAPGLALRIITGVCSGCVMANCSKIVAVNFAPQERAIGMGILLASPPFGITLANTIGNPLNAAMGWRKTFLLVGVLAVVVIAALLLFVKPIPKAPVSAAVVKKPGMLEGLKVFFSDPQQLILGLSGFLFMFVTVGFATWANTYAGTLGFTRAQGDRLQHCRYRGLLPVRRHRQAAEGGPQEFPADQPGAHERYDPGVQLPAQLHRADDRGHRVRLRVLSALHPLHHPGNAARR